MANTAKSLIVLVIHARLSHRFHLQVPLLPPTRTHTQKGRQAGKQTHKHNNNKNSKPFPTGNDDGLRPSTDSFAASFPLLHIFMLHLPQSLSLSPCLSFCFSSSRIVKYCDSFIVRLMKMLMSLPITLLIRPSVG